MFETPAEYNSVNEFTVRTTQEVLQEYGKYIKFAENDLILDVGCGSGNVTAEVLLPAIPCKDFCLIGVDKSEAMVDFANKHYKGPKLTFRVLNIANKASFATVFSKKELNTGFDIIFSFCCIHWNKDYHQCYSNIYSLLKPGGQICIMKMGYSTLNDVFYTVRCKDEWRPYLEHEPVFKYPYHNSTDAAQQCSTLLKEVGFQNIICDCVSKPHQIVGPPPSEILCNVMKVIDPYLHKIPEHRLPEYYDDIYEVLNEKFHTTNMLPYDRIVVIATKPVT